ncbi:MAG: HAMP domain-containing protein [Bacteroidetes bacterium]|nr:HAMP domain-containing protein [Bacteroidota bacterium]
MKKLFLQMGALILFFIAFVILVNSLFLEFYYISNQKNKLKDYYQTINSMKSEDYNNRLADFVLMETTSNIDILVLNSAGDLLYATNSYMSDKNKIDNLLLITKPAELFPEDFAKNTPEKPRPAPMKITKVEEINNDVKFIWTQDPNFNHQVLLLSGNLDNGNLIELAIPLALIKTNIKLSNNFLLIIGILILILALISVYFVSRHFTKPIREMNDVTKRMKNLDFNISCTVRTKDEIGELAGSINEMSIELYKTIQSIKEKNEQLEKEINEKNRLAEKRRELLSNVSHELKTPLALMQGYAEGLKIGVAKESDKADFYCDVILDETNKMNQLVEGLLNIDEMELGQVILKKSEFEVNAFLLHIFNKYKKILNEKEIKYLINIIEPIMVVADAFKIERVFTNYITNAMNYVDDKRLIKITILRLDKHIRVEIFNTANPIMEKKIPKLWDSFYKIDKARTRDFGGHGLGLSIIKAIQDLHHNAYGVKNVPDGICFWFDITLSENQNIIS